MYKIETMVAIKSGCGIGKKGCSKYPIRDLKPGQGFYAPADKQGSLASLVSRIAKDTGRKFGVYKVDAERIQVVELEVK